MIATAITSGADFAGAERSPVVSPDPTRDCEQAKVFAGFGHRIEVKPRVSVRQVATIIGVASACWLAVFAAGYALLH